MNDVLVMVGLFGVSIIVSTTATTLLVRGVLRSLFKTLIDDLNIRVTDVEAGNASLKHQIDVLSQSHKDMYTLLIDTRSSYVRSTGCLGNAAHINTFEQLKKSVSNIEDLIHLIIARRPHHRLRLARNYVNMNDAPLVNASADVEVEPEEPG